ncbi:MAG: polysaccharide deacetylase family protein [Defluviitaleaceae bacterium]|nr:polysaccharide deacetylase family protein [Defluviitaleaceae bacterium]
MPRYLIINADDFGVCPATNEAIERVFNEGIISSATIMTPCPSFTDAVERAKANPKMQVGLHITTTAEYTRKWGPIAPNVPSIADENGFMYPTVAEFAKNARTEEVAIEIEAQYQLLLQNGVTPTHADSHMGSLYGLSGPSFMKEALEFCAKHKLPFRFPEEIESVKRNMKLEEVPAQLAEAHSQVIAYAKALGVNLIDHLITSTIPFSEITSYEKLRTIYFDIISSLPEGICEIYMHPALADSVFAQGNHKWQTRVWEYQLLMDASFKKHLESEGVSLVSYKTASFN